LERLAREIEEAHRTQETDHLVITRYSSEKRNGGNLEKGSVREMKKILLSYFRGAVKQWLASLNIICPVGLACHNLWWIEDIVWKNNETYAERNFGLE